MDSLLNPVSTKSFKKVDELTHNVQPLEPPTGDKKPSAAPQTPESVISLLTNQPSLHVLSQSLQYLSITRSTRQEDGFNILLPSPKSAQIVYPLVNDILLHFWPILSTSEKSEDLKIRKHLLQCLRSNAGLGAILARLKAEAGEIQNGEAAKLGTSQILCDVSQLLLRGDGCLTAVWKTLQTCEDRPGRPEMFWKEFVQLIATGRVVSIAAEIELLLREKSKDVHKSIWIADGKSYADWLGRNLGHMVQRLSEQEWSNGGLKSIKICYGRGLNLGYTDHLVGAIFHPLLHGEETLLSRYRHILRALSHHEQKVTLFAIVRHLSKRRREKSEKYLEAAARLLSDLCDNNRDLLGHLNIWLSGTSAEAINHDNYIHRVVVLALSTNMALMRSTAQKVLETFSDKLFIKHSPVLHQEVNARILLLLWGYIHKVDQRYLSGVSKSSVYLSSISNHLAASSPKIRFLGMVVGSTVSEKIDATGSQLKFKAEDSQSAEWLWYQTLFDVEDGLGAIADLKTIETLTSKSKKDVDKSPSTNGTSKSVSAAHLTSKVVAIEEIEDDSGTESEDDDIVPYAKPDSDPSDDDEDPTLVQRNKPKAPVYIRDVVAGLRDIENYDVHTLALRNATNLIRRKTGFGTEVEDHLEELAAIIVGLKDRWELDDFPQLRLQSILALLVAKPQSMGPWLSQSFYTGDYSFSQRAAILTALGLGAREIAGIGKDDEALTGAVHSKDAFASKRLPQKLHSHYAIEAAPMDTLTSQLSKTMIQPLAASAADQVTGPNALKVRTFSSRMEVEKKRSKPTSNPLAKIVAESFFIPLTGRWQVQTQVMGENAPQASPMLLSQMLKTLSLTLHAAGPTTLALPQLTSEFWNFLLAVRTKAEDKTVLESLLFALLALLDVNEENQRSMAEEHGQELLETQEWVSDVLGRVGGGEEEGERCRMLAAGVLVKCREVVEKYQRLLMGDMIDF